MNKFLQKMSKDKWHSFLLMSCIIFLPFDIFLPHSSTLMVFIDIFFGIYCYLNIDDVKI